MENRYKDFHPSVEFLSRNFRSQKEIVEFNNLVFGAENLKRFIGEIAGEELGASAAADITKVFEGAKQSFREEKKYGCVRAEFIDGKDADERNDVVKEKLLELIGALGGRFLPEEIAILARANKDVELLSEWLLEAGVPVESEKTLNIRENARIKELISFLKFLDFPPDNLSFASFILSEIFQKAGGVDAEAMRSYVAQLGKDKKGGSLEPFYQKFRREFPKLWDGFIGDFYKKVGFVPAYELAVSIMEKFDIMRNFPEDQGFFMKFLDLVKEYEEESTSVSSFLEYFDEANDEDLYVRANSANAVRVLTIHKAKGLEFSAVIIPFLEMDVGVGQGGWRSKPYVIREEDDGIRLLRLSKKSAEYSPLLKELYKEEYKKSLIDELNALYVAMTRAKDELYCFIPAKSGASINLAKFLIPLDGGKLERGKQITPHLKSSPLRGEDKKDIPPSQYMDPLGYSWIALLKNEFIDEEILRNRDKILKGAVMHYVLSFIGNLHNQDKERVIKDAIAKARPAYPFISDFSEFEHAIAKLLDSERHREFFFVADGEVYQEKEIVNSYGDTKRIDRLIVRKGEVAIVDYKSSREERDLSACRAQAGEKYRGQISEYIKIIRDVYPGSSVKGFLIYLDDLSMDVVNG